MHYIHKLTSAQKKAAIAVFMGVPAALLVLIIWMWGYNRGLFKKVAYIKTVLVSSQGIDTETPVTFSGMKIGRVTGLGLGKGEEVVLTLMIDNEFLGRIKTDSVAVASSASVLGIKELRIRGGSAAAPAVKNGDTIASQDLFDMGNLMDRVSPLLSAAEKIIFRIEAMLNAFPNEKVNNSVTGLSEIIDNIRTGQATVGKLVSTDKGAFYDRLDRLSERLAGLTERMETSTRRLPETMDNVADISGRVSTASKRLPETMDNVAGITGNLKTSSNEWPAIQKNVNHLVNDLNKVVRDLAEMTPAIKKSVENVQSATGDVSTSTARVPMMLDEIDVTLNETLMIVKGLKTAWPVKNMVPPDREKQPLESGARETPYEPGGAGQ